MTGQRGGAMREPEHQKSYPIASRSGVQTRHPYSPEWPSNAVIHPGAQLGSNGRADPHHDLLLVREPSR
ncbi:hypothetical protein N7447_004938 [Penicillium robsamsonii]|uniref:uncharacterized protein n=1 Tax=Penicillium robsamsonii TaxID=1792511 RepID=UPI0025487F0E|nr:uncharacterized protein N7447_004938 [Penicillium robsamsonii]KAJ5822598.1 hypothetical protein N7447_004938 [Penicillium robsamsonii]